MARFRGGSPPTLTYTMRSVPNARRIHNVADARRLSRRAMPRALFDYVDGGAEDEVTMGENERAFREITFRPRMGMKIDRPLLATTVLGTPVALPVLLAPCGLVRLMHVDGPVGAARAARRAGTVSVLSTVAGVPPEALAGEPGPRWFQLYASERAVAAHLMDKAAAAGFGVLVVTIDTPAVGKRERDLRNGVDFPIRVSARSVTRLGPQLLARPAWTFRMVRQGMQLSGDHGHRRSMYAVASAAGAPLAAQTPAGTVTTPASPFGWDDIAWIRSRWSGPLVIKGLLTSGDAIRAAECGADGVVVSNHGGRQLEGAPATIQALPEIVDAVGDRLDVLMDGGVRRGGDVIKALALGARAVLVGRPYLYALAAAGEPGVARMLEIFRDEMTTTLSLLGCPTVSELDRSWLRGA